MAQKKKKRVLHRGLSPVIAESIKEKPALAVKRIKR
jgi:hypothetical protein